MAEHEKLFLGIELGSTRIKSVLINEKYEIKASGAFDWENRFEDGYFTYRLEDVHTGLRESFAALADDYKEKNGTGFTIDAIGISAMMHGYLVFDGDMRLLTPFRTWRNSKAKQASDELTELFSHRIPQRWSIANLYQSMINGEEHVKHISYLTTLAGYIHMRMTGRNEVGLCEASGMFPVSGEGYDKKRAALFNEAARKLGYDTDILAILPEPRPAGSAGAYLTEEGAAMIDGTGILRPGIPVCPPEGDAGTGMTATNSVRPGTGSVSAGTSVFAQLVTDRPLSRVYRGIDVLKTPDGADVALIHSTNGCSDIDKWVSLFDEFAKLCGVKLGKTELYSLLYNNTKNADADCGKIAAYNCISAEPSTDVPSGHPLVFREFDGKLDLANFFKANLCAVFAPLIPGMRMLREGEGIRPGKIYAHGGLFKIPEIAQQILADAFEAPVSVLSSAGESGAYGMALLSAFMISGNGKKLSEWLDTEVFAGSDEKTLLPTPQGVGSYRAYMERYEKGLPALRALS